METIIAFLGWIIRIFGPIKTLWGWIMLLWPSVKRRWAKPPPAVIQVKLLPRTGDDYFLEVRNLQPAVALARVFLLRVTDREGTSTGQVTSEVEVYYQNSLDVPSVFGDRLAMFAFLSVDRRYPAGPCLRVNTVNTDASQVRSKGEMIVSNPAPLEAQQEIRLQIQVVFYHPDTKQVSTHNTIVYRVRSQPTAGGYAVELVEEARR